VTLKVEFIPIKNFSQPCSLPFKQPLDGDLSLFRVVHTQVTGFEKDQTPGEIALREHSCEIIHFHLTNLTGRFADSV